MKLTLALSLLALLLYATPATSADRGFFIGAGAAQVDLDVDDVYGTGIDFDEGDTGFKVFGGFRFFRGSASKAHAHTSTAAAAQRLGRPLARSPQV